MHEVTGGSQSGGREFDPRAVHQPMEKWGDRTAERRAEIHRAVARQPVHDAHRPIAFDAVDYHAGEFVDLRVVATRAVGSARMDGVITREIRSYVSRDWAAARESKDAFWATRIAQFGPIEGLRIADELRRQVVRQNPGWPDDEERHDDLAAHMRLSDLLRRAGPPRSR